MRFFEGRLDLTALAALAIVAGVGFAAPSAVAQINTDASGAVGDTVGADISDSVGGDPTASTGGGGIDVGSTTSTLGTAGTLGGAEAPPGASSLPGLANHDARARLEARLAGMTQDEILALRRQCAEILTNPGRFESGLLHLCQLMNSM